jgi:DNA-binding transcriptional MerR regulator
MIRKSGDRFCEQIMLKQGSDMERAEEDNDGALFSIGDLAGEFGISTRAIRFYEIKRLIAPRRVGANRVYSRRDRARLLLILRGKRLGFSLDEVAEYLNLYDVDPHQLAQTRLLLQKVENAIADLEQKQIDIEKTLAELKEIRQLAIHQLKGRARTAKD